MILTSQSGTDVHALDYINYDISQLLLSDLFGIDSSRSTRWTPLITEQKDLLEKNDRTPEEDARLKELDKELSALSYGDTLAQIQSRELMQKIAERLQIK